MAGIEINRMTARLFVNLSIVPFEHLAVDEVQARVGYQNGSVVGILAKEHF